MPRMKVRPTRGQVGAAVLVALASYSLAQALPSTGLAAAGTQRSTTGRIVPTPSPGSGIPTVGPGITLAKSGRIIPPGRPAVHVPILMYHYIRVNPEPHDRLGFNLSVAPADFSAQMNWLAGHGFQPIDMRDLRDYLLGKRPLPAKPVVITLDDGYRDLYTTAFPILKEHRFKAVAYIVTGFVDGPGTVTRQQVIEMDANRIEIGSHSVSHPDLTKLAPEELRRQLQDSKVSLESMLRHPILDFCYPAGVVNPTVLQATQVAGYETATTTAAGTQHSASDRFLWGRVRVGGGESLEQFAASLGPEEPSELEAVSGQPRVLEPTPAAPQQANRRLTLSRRAPTQVALQGSLSP
jgi:peptidoglycan/xylan/chitin deacetylase (PgdA/CDA1 family)